MQNPVIDRLAAERQTQVDFIDQTLARVESESRDLVQAETDNLTAARERIQALDAQLAPLREFEELREAGRTGAAQYRATGAPDNGGQQGGQRLAARTEPRGHEYRTAGEIMVDAVRAGQLREDDAVERLRANGLTIMDGTLVRAAAPHTTTAEVPGLLTTSIVGSIMSDIDATRPFISSLGAKDLGGIPGVTFKRPTVTEHVQVGKQGTGDAGQKTEVVDGQFKIGGIDFTKETYGGWTNVAKQFIDWLSPAAWDALLRDFQEIYGIETEDDAADAFATAVVAVTGSAMAGATPTVEERLKALYDAAALAYGGVKRLPNHIWMSLDEWATWGPMIDNLKATTAGDGGGSSSVNSFAGQLLNTPRTVVPSFAAGTTIVGVKEKYEVYEDRFGFLSAVQPRVFGVELAYGGYMAHGMLDADGFAKVTFV